MSDFFKREREETDVLLSQALDLGIHVPREPDWWWIDDEVAQAVDSEMWKMIADNHTYLTNIGKANVKRLIRDERSKLKDEVRKDIAWRRQEILWKLTICWDDRRMAFRNRQHCHQPRGTFPRLSETLSRAS